MKKLIVSSSCIVAICLIISFGVLPSIKGSTTEKENSSTIEKENSSDTISSSSVTSYIVKTFDGSIAVFENGKDTPFKVTSVPINSLPYADQEILKNGIIVNGKNELKDLLEDYCS